MFGMDSGGGSGGGSSSGGGGFADAIGSLAGGITGIWQQPVAHQWASAANKHAMAFARWMDNTKYRRATRDLKAAGLNPMLAYTSGYHGSSMMGASAQPSSGGSGSDITEGMSRGASTARALREASTNFNILKNREKVSENEVTTSEALADKTQSEAGIAHSELGRRDALLAAETEARRAAASASNASAAYTEEDRGMLQVLKRLKSAEVPSAEAIKEFDSTWLGQLLLKIGRGAEPVGKVVGPLGAGAVGGVVGGKLRKTRQDTEFGSERIGGAKRAKPGEPGR